MQELLQQPSFRIYAAVVGLLLIKTVSLAMAAGIMRGPRKAWINPEDTKLQGGEVKAEPTIDRINRAHTNAIHNILPFAIVGLLYVLMGASTSGLQIYAYTFFGARVLHTAFYLFKVQPLRSVTFVVGALCIIGMSVQVLMRAFA